MNDLVIIVDDDPTLARLVADILSHHGFRAVCGTGGKDLTRLLAEHADAAAVLCDQSLFGETGLGLYARFKPQFDARRIAFVLLHGSGGLIAEEVRTLGIRELHKPPKHIRDIADAVREEIDRVRPPSSTS